MTSLNFCYFPEFYLGAVRKIMFESKHLSLEFFMWCLRCCIANFRQIDWKTKKRWMVKTHWKNSRWPPHITNKKKKIVRHIYHLIWHQLKEHQLLVNFKISPYITTPVLKQQRVKLMTLSEPACSRLAQFIWIKTKYKETLNNLRIRHCVLKCFLLNQNLTIKQVDLAILAWF